MPIRVRADKNANAALDTKTGVYIPLPDGGSMFPSPYPVSAVASPDGKATHIPGTGTKFTFDPGSGLVVWPRYATGSDDLLNRAIVRGHMANGGLTPVPATLVSTIVSKMQQTAATWIMNISGRASPVARAVEIVALADNSTIGPAVFIQNYVGAIYTDNRGAICSTLPIGEIEFDKWDQYGMNAVKIETGKHKNRYVLEVDPERLRANLGLWSVDGLDCSPTGYHEYPYWIRKQTKGEHGPVDVWVLIPKEVGFQILQPAGPKHDLYKGYGQSGTWRASPLVAEGLANTRMRLEAYGDTPPNGVLGIAGLDWPTQFRESYQAFLEEQKSRGNLLTKEPFMFGTRSRDMKMEFVAWTNPPPGYTPQGWFDELTTTLAAAYHLNEAHIRLRYGDGVSQAEIADALESETAVAFLRNMIEAGLNQVVPPRVMVRVIWKSDRSVVRQLESFSLLSLAISRLQKRAGEMADEEPPFTNETILAMIEQTIGLEIPEVGPEIESVSSPATPEDFHLPARLLPELPRFDRCGIPREVLHRAGTLVCDHQGKVYQITSVAGGLIWGVTSNGFIRLLHPYWLFVVKLMSGDPAPTDRKRGRKYAKSRTSKRIAPKAGDRAKTTDGATVLVHSVDGNKATINFEWDKGVEPRFYPLSELTRFQFEPTGSPLPYPESFVFSDRDEAIDAADELWREVMGDAAAVIDGTWNEDQNVWETADGEPMTRMEMAALRDTFRQATDDIYTDMSADTSLVALLLLGLFSLAEWEARMRQTLASAYLAMYLFARGGSGRLRDEDWDIIEAEILLQMQFLNLFAQEILAGIMSEGQIANRAGLYFQSMAAMYEDAQAASYDYRLILPANPGDCSSECCSNCKCTWAFAQTDTVIMAQWIRNAAAESCPTCLRRESCSPLIFIRETGEHLGADCY